MSRGRGTCSVVVALTRSDSVVASQMVATRQRRLLPCVRAAVGAFCWGPVSGRASKHLVAPARPLTCTRRSDAAGADRLGASRLYESRKRGCPSAQLDNARVAESPASPVATTINHRRRGIPGCHDRLSDSHPQSATEPPMLVIVHRGCEISNRARERSRAGGRRRGLLAAHGMGCAQDGAEYRGGRKADRDVAAGVGLRSSGRGPPAIPCCSSEASSGARPVVR